MRRALLTVLLAGAPALICMDLPAGAFAAVDAEQSNQLGTAGSDNPSNGSFSIQISPGLPDGQLRRSS